MKLGIDFKEGDELWYCYIQFARGRLTKAVKRTFPTKCRIVRRVGYPGCYYVEDINSGLKLLNINEGFDYSNYLYLTEEDCRQHWRSVVLNKIDQIVSIHQEDLKYLNKFLELKNKSKGN